jgi:phosphomannomutase
MLAQAICSGLASIGRDVVYGDVAATPTTGVLVREHKAAGGIQISASHNPAPYNGIKLFSDAGRVIDAVAGEKVIDAYRDYELKSVPFDKVGTIIDLEDTTTSHLKSVLETVNVEAIRAKGFKVVLDSHHGAGSVLGQRLLESLGCQFECLGAEPDGKFEHPPEPTEANLQDTVKRSVAFGADVVFCQDPDADRLAVIDASGTYIGEEYTLAITLNHALSKKPGNVVINCSSSRMSADLCDRHNSTLHLSAVGEANVTGKMIELDAVYGGEGNGGPIDPRVGYVRDSFVAMAQVLDAMAEQNKSVAELVADIPSYEICKTKVQIERNKVPKLYDALKNHFSDAEFGTMDGLRLDWPNKWMLVRPSNTEPIVRAIAEATTMEEAQALCDAAAEAAAKL